jgi:hypothetical protein
MRHRSITYVSQYRPVGLSGRPSRQPAALRFSGADATVWAAGRPGRYATLESQLAACPRGKAGWARYEEICTGILATAFAPPLRPPRRQTRTLYGLERRDALFPLRGAPGAWEAIRREFDANFLLVEFKNYARKFGKEEVNQARNYLRTTIGRLAIVCSRVGPDDGALRMRNSIFAQERKMILFFGDAELAELLRRRAADPGGNRLVVEFVQATIEDFYVTYE